MKRLIACLLALLMLLSLTACGETPESSPTTDTTAAPTDGESAPDTEPFPDVAKQDYDGETFRMVGTFEAGTWVFGDEESYNNKGNKQVLNDVLYEMNTMVEEHLGITIEYEYVEHVPGSSVIVNKVHPTILSGDDAYQLCVLDSYRNVSPFVIQDCAMDLYELEGLDFDRAYWNREVIESLEIEDHAYIALGDLCNYTVYPFYVNKDLLATVGRQMPYDKVRNGTWTFDELFTITADLYADNGDGKINNQDTFGFAATWNVGANCFLQASDIYVVTRHDDGSYDMTLYNDRFVDLFNKLLNWTKEDSVYIWEWGKREDTGVITNFLDGHIYFTQEALGTTYLEAEFAVGILPLPKFNTAQKEYAHCSWGNNLGVPRTVKNTTMVAQAMELMSYYSMTMVRTKYYDEVLQLRVSDAPDDREMVELICDTVVFDPGIAYSQNSSELFNLCYILESNILSGNTNISSYYTRNERAAERYLSKKVYKLE